MQNGSFSKFNPVPVYHKTDVLFKLARSPYESVLLFANQLSAIATTPLSRSFGFTSGIRLFSLKPNSIDVSVLLKQKTKKLHPLNTEQDST